MAKEPDTIETVRKALRSEARIDLQHHPIHLTLSADDLIINGEVADIAVKKLALERAAAVADVRGIVDRLRVAPAERLGDGTIRDLVRDALVDEPAFRACSIRVSVGNRWTRSAPSMVRSARSTSASRRAWSCSTAAFRTRTEAAGWCPCLVGAGKP